MGIVKPVTIEVAKIPIRTIERNITKLVSMGKIERKGSRKTGGYYTLHTKKVSSAQEKNRYLSVKNQK